MTTKNEPQKGTIFRRNIYGVLCARPGCEKSSQLSADTRQKAGLELKGAGWLPADAGWTCPACSLKAQAEKFGFKATLTTQDESDESDDRNETECDTGNLGGS